MEGSKLQLFQRVWAKIAPRSLSFRNGGQNTAAALGAVCSAVITFALAEAPAIAQTIKPTIDKLSEVELGEVASGVLHSALFHPFVTFLLGALFLVTIVSFIIREYQISLLTGSACMGLFLIRYIAQFLTSPLALVQWIFLPVLLLTVGAKLCSAYSQHKREEARERAERLERRPSFRVRGMESDEYGAERSPYSGGRTEEYRHSSTPSNPVKLNRPF